MANFVGSLLTVILLCELGIFMDKVTAQTFSVNPASIVELTPGEDEYDSLSCTFTRNSQTDVIGWVVNGVRISNGVNKISSAIGTALGAGAEDKMQLLENPVVNTESWRYDIDFFSASEVLNGDYMCQLCTDDTCGTVIAESTVAQVRVAYEPSTPPTCRPETATRVVLGEPVTLSCASDPGVPTVQLQWLRNTQVMSGQGEPVLVDGVLFQNHTFVPGVNDDDPGVTYTCSRTSASSTASCSITQFILVSTPHVVVRPPTEGIAPGSSGTYTCSATSETNTPIVEYNWDVPGVDSSRRTVSDGGRTVTIDAITAADHEKVVKCEVTDAQNMKGSGQYIILVEGEVIPSNLPTVPSVGPTNATTPVPTSLPSDFPMAAIIAIAVVGFILLCIVFGGIWFFQNKRKQGKQTLPPTKVVKNDLSPTSASPYKSEKTFNSNYSDAKQPDPDVIPKGPNERPVDVDDADWWRESGAPNDQMPLKQVNIPVQSMGSNTRLEDPYKYNPTYDDKADPAELDYKVPLDDHDYGDGYGYRGDGYGYPDDDYSKKYNDMRYSEDGFDGHNYSDRVYGDGQQDSYSQGYGDEYNRDPMSNYDTVFGDGYEAPAAPYSSGYDRYPDRMPDGSEGYEPPPPEEYNDQPYDVYSTPTDYGRPDDYSGVGDYNQPNDYSSDPHDMGYGVQPAEYDDRPADYDYQHPSSGAHPNSYNEGPYNDQYNSPYDPERIPDGGAPDSGDYDSYNYPVDGEPYGNGYSNEPGAYNDEAGYTPSGYQPYSDQYQGTGHPQGEPYFDPEEEVSATSNPSYV